MIEQNIVIVVCLDDAPYLLPDKVLNDTLSELLDEEHPETRGGVIPALSKMDPDLTPGTGPLWCPGSSAPRYLLPSLFCR